MDEKDQQSKLDQILEIALNPVGSISFCERLGSRGVSFHADFYKLLAPKAVDLILSPIGYRVIQSCINAHVVEIDESLVKTLSSSPWVNMEKILKNANGRYVCETLLSRSRGNEALALSLIMRAPKTWWFEHDEAISILFKVIDIVDIEISKDFISDEPTAIELCDIPEGLYCVLKVVYKLGNDVKCVELLTKLVQHKAKSVTGCESLFHVVIYGIYLSGQVTEMLCSNEESYDNSITVALITRIIQWSSTPLRAQIFSILSSLKKVNCHECPFICHLRNYSGFNFLKSAFIYFTTSQREHLESCLLEFPVEEAANPEKMVIVPPIIVETSSPMANTFIPQAEFIVDMPVKRGNMKRRLDQITKQSTPVLKKLREESYATTCKSVLPLPLLPSIISSPSSIHISTQSTTLTTSSASVRPTLPSLHSSSPSPSAQTTPEVSLSISNIDNIPERSNLIVKKEEGIGKGFLMTHLSNAKNTDSAQKTKVRTVGVDPGMDVISMALSGNCEKIVKGLEKSLSKRTDMPNTIFNCIHNGLLALMMDEQGSKVIKWFMEKGSFVHKGTIENKVMECVEDLVNSGGYGREIVRGVIEGCYNADKKRKMQIHFDHAIRHPREFSPMEEKMDEDIEIVGEVIKKKKSDNEVKENSKPNCTKEMNNGKNGEMKTKDVKHENNLAMSNPRETYSAFDRLRISFDEIDGLLSDGKLKDNEIFRIVNSDVILTAHKRIDTSREFTNLVATRIKNWMNKESSLSLLLALAYKKTHRPMLITPIASVLHFLAENGWKKGELVINLMLTSHTRTTFINKCLEGNGRSLFMTLFRSQLDGAKCTCTAMKFVNAELIRFRRLFAVPAVRCDLLKTEKGRQFYETLAAPSPVGRGWTELTPPSI